MYLEALLALSSDPETPVINDGRKSTTMVLYGFVDASGQGFRSFITTGEGIKYRIGTWGSDEDSTSSNWKEFSNLVSTLEQEAQSGNLDNTLMVVTCIRHEDDCPENLLKILKRE